MSDRETIEEGKTHLKEWFKLDFPIRTPIYSLHSDKFSPRLRLQCFLLATSGHTQSDTKIASTKWQFQCFGWQEGRKTIARETKRSASRDFEAANLIVIAERAQQEQRFPRFIYRAILRNFFSCFVHFGLFLRQRAFSSPIRGQRWLSRSELTFGGKRETIKMFVMMTRLRFWVLCNAPQLTCVPTALRKKRLKRRNFAYSCETRSLDELTSCLRLLSFPPLSAYRAIEVLF